jgi:predicted phosphodiesterase
MPMRIAVISDIHGNLVAFKEVLRDIDRSKIDRIVSLGDSIGYGPESEEVLNLIQSRNIDHILGNHERAILDETYRQYFMRGAVNSTKQTMKFLTASSLHYLRSLPKTKTIDDALFVHGCPPESHTIYLNHLTISEIADAFQTFTNKIAFSGHTHKFMLFSYNGKKVDFRPPKNEPMILGHNLRYIFNVGSVGQPRDNDSRAGYVIWDTDVNSLEVKRIPYNIRATAEKIIQRGFRRNDADRLFAGE